MEFTTISRDEAKRLVRIIEGFSRSHVIHESDAQELSDLNERLQLFADSKPAPLASARQRLHAKIQAEVPARNAVNQKCNELTLALRIYFSGLKGCKVQNKDGNPIKKVRGDIDKIMTMHNGGGAFRCFTDFSCHNITVKVDARYKSPEREGVEYVKAVGFICRLDNGIVGDTYEGGYRLEDYTAEEVIAALDQVVLCQNVVDDARHNLFDFNHYWQ